MLVQGDKERTLLALVTARAWKDPWFRQRLVDDPRAVLREEGVRLPEEVAVSVLEDTDEVKHVIVPEGAPAEAQLARVGRHLPLQPGAELRVVGTSPRTRFLILPVAPARTDLFNVSDAELLAAVSQDSVTEVTVEATVAVTTEATVTQTTEVETIETTTTVVAEAELVAT